MKREDLPELHYITAISNVPSILRGGILSHRRAAGQRHQSVAMAEIQERRRAKGVPGGRSLHEYVNLYVCARNPMLFKRKDQHLSLCVLRIDPAILDLPGVVIADGNAASKYTGFWPSPSGLARLDRELVFPNTGPIRIRYSSGGKPARSLLKCWSQTAWSRPRCQYE